MKIELENNDYREAITAVEKILNDCIEGIDAEVKEQVQSHIVSYVSDGGKMNDYGWTVEGYHYPDSPFFEDMDESFNLVIFDSWQEMRDLMGYVIEQLMGQQLEEK